VVTTAGEAEVAQVGEPLGGSASIGADEGKQARKAQVGMGLKKRRTRKHKWTRIGAHRQSAKGRMWRVCCRVLVCPQSGHWAVGAVAVITRVKVWASQVRASRRSGASGGNWGGAIMGNLVDETAEPRGGIENAHTATTARVGFAEQRRLFP
jgi:hypothetical protein